MNISVSVSGGAESISAAAERIQAALPAALLAGAEAVAESARGMCPVDTGRLRSSIGASQSGDGAIAYAGEDLSLIHIWLRLGAPVIIITPETMATPTYSTLPMLFRMGIIMLA